MRTGVAREQSSESGNWVIEGGRKYLDIFPRRRRSWWLYQNHHIRSGTLCNQLFHRPFHTIHSLFHGLFFVAEDPKSRKFGIEDDVAVVLDANGIKCLQARSHDIFRLYLVSWSYGGTDNGTEAPFPKAWPYTWLPCKSSFPLLMLEGAVSLNLHSVLHAFDEIEYFYI